MRALILWAEPESTNLGVRALAAGTSRLLADTFGGSDGAVDVAFQGFGAGDAPARIGDYRTQLKRLTRRSDILVDWVRGFDLIVDTRGGDSFADIYGIKRLATMGLMSEIARRARVPLVLGPQTIGPFDSIAGKAMGRRSLHLARLVLVRDGISEDVARRMKADPVLATDVVFAIEAPPVAEQDRDVIVNVSGLLWGDNPHTDATAYRQSVLTLCRRLIESGRSVTLLAHVLSSTLADNDVTAVDELAAQLGGSCETVVPADLAEVRSVLAGANLVIGSRMHACLNALSVGTPAIALAYSRKFAPLLADLGWTRTVDLRTGTGHAEQVLALMDDPGLAADVKVLRDKADQRIERARQSLVRAL